MHNNYKKLNIFICYFLFITYFTSDVAYAKLLKQIIKAPNGREFEYVYDDEKFIKDKALDIIKRYETENGKKLMPKWRDKVLYRLKNEDNYNKNYKLPRTVLFQIMSKEKNLEMSYTSKETIKTTPTPYKVRRISDKELRKMSEDSNKSIEKFYTPKHIPNCKKSFTETEANSGKSRYVLHENGEVIFDELMLSKNVLKYIKMEALLDKDFFGNKNMVRFYSEEFMDFSSLSFKDSEIKCLPIRVIVTTDTITKHYGVNALKNYDFKKEGELHYLVKKNLKKLLLDLDN